MFFAFGNGLFGSVFILQRIDTTALGFHADQLLTQLLAAFLCGFPFFFRFMQTLTDALLLFFSGQIRALIIDIAALGGGVFQYVVVDPLIDITL